MRKSTIPADDYKRSNTCDGNAGRLEQELDFELKELVRLTGPVRKI